MVFSGPGIYGIIPYQSPEMILNSWGGNENAGEVIRLYNRGDRSKPAENELWQVALVEGQALTDDAVYTINNVKNGYFLAATGPNKIVSCEHRSPKDPTVRWNIKSRTTNGYDVWLVNSKSRNGQLNVSNGGKTSGTDILSWPISDTDNCKFYFDAYN